MTLTDDDIRTTLTVTDCPAMDTTDGGNGDVGKDVTDADPR